MGISEEVFEVNVNVRPINLQWRKRTFRPCGMQAHLYLYCFIMVKP